MEGAKSVTGIVRGCGMRKPGGLYVCSGLSPYGAPLQSFIIDPAIPYNGEPFRAPIVIEKEGKKHIMLWVGAEYYPYCSDYLEEVRQYGASKRVPNNFPIEELEEGSMLFLVHPKGIIEDFEYLPTVEFCPKDIQAHREENKECCLGHSYQIAEPTVGLDTRKLGDTKYKVYPHSMSSQEYEFTAGIFLRLPITHFDHILVKGKANSKITGKTTKLPVNLEKD
jgi:hypothetical protein